ncbi:hypothetical protein SPRG_22121 [Saprolegnia parasitica CBS 223.65]|uniref:BED-type domain-containing protein n=1 Tax=Saprolegnia parasitica (strain CBS 223.65) TaxID=695850 RepID=A0A067CMD2_SAPPC|nr:hypothetical protein SPRG_22121 [Saprolegnia parasitica CBS 223.65]KDO31658.1 hypothetical protein SPRG_22121 [Saprolegnia parasitica CBS 223.65]|eukprot:XP_012197781.1 hypothetical protein SPRG_22121 [Saprolegnia parasitica CBS 223.65]
MGNPTKFTTVPIESVKHGILRIFKLKNISRPEIWANASLVAPGNAPECASRDVTHFYCHLCDDIFKHDPTRLQNLHRHMKAKHLSNIQQIQQDMVPSNVVIVTAKRKEPTPNFVQSLVEDLPLPEPKRSRPHMLSATTFRSTKHGALSLFKVKHINRPEIWMYVSLVAPTNVEMNPATGWTSRDASHFYCHLCDDCFPHDYARSQNLHRHVKNKHKAELDAYMKKLLKSTEARVAENKPPPAPSAASLSMASDDTRRCELALAEWLATCRRPLELVADEPFQRFLTLLQSTQGHFSLPSRATLEAHMDELYAAKRKAMHALLDDECRYFSLSAKTHVSSPEPHLVWTLHYITPSFEWRHLLLSHHDWLLQALNRVLVEWNLSSSNLTMIVSDVDWRLLPHVPSMMCMGQTLHAVLCRLLYGKDDDDATALLDDPPFLHLSTESHDESSIPALAKRTLDHFVSTHRRFDARATVNCPRQWQKLYNLLSEWQSMKPGVDLFFSVVETQPASFPFPCTVSNLSRREWCLLEGLLVLLEPCLEVMHAVFSQASTNSLAVMLSILQLFAKDVATPRFFHLRGFTSLDEEPAVLYELNAARHMLQTLLFGFLDDHPAMWTCPLHPSIAATLAHCTDEEKAQVKHRLATECADVASEKQPPKKKTATTRSLKYLQQVMGATRDEILDSMGIDTLSVEDELQMYFATVVPGIEDTLGWWKTHHSMFPRLAGLARKWLCTTATAFHKSQDETIDEAPRLGDVAARMAFLADNSAPDADVAFV